MFTGLLVPVAFRNKCERATGPEPFQSIFPGVNATRTSGTGLERDRNANRNRCEQGLRVSKLPALERIVKDCFTELGSNVPSFLDHTYLLNG